MIEYSDFLNELINIGRFLRFFTSNRVRKRLDHINTQIYKEATDIYLELQQKAKTAKKSAGVKKTKDLPPYTAELEKLTQCFRDDDARIFWENNFEQAFVISWDRFVSALKQTLPLDATSVDHLQYILDNSNTGFISMYRFSDFLNGFGPLKQCLDKVEGVLNAEWFHGFLSSTETEKLLEKQPSGTFLIRFSKSKPGSFAIGYVEGDNRLKTTHTLIACAPPSGFKIEEAYQRNARGRLFASLYEVVDFYNYLLKFTLRSDLSRLSWFHGDLTSQEADELLGNAENGSYLIRFSSTPGCLAISYVNNKTVKHGLLETVPNGYRFDGKPKIYSSLNDLTNELNDILRIPLSNLTFELNPNYQKPTPAPEEVPAQPMNAPTAGNYASFVGVLPNQSNGSKRTDYGTVDFDPNGVAIAPAVITNAAPLFNNNTSNPSTPTTVRRKDVDDDDSYINTSQSSPYANVQQINGTSLGNYGSIQFTTPQPPAPAVFNNNINNNNINNNNTGNDIKPTTPSVSLSMPSNTTNNYGTLPLNLGQHNNLPSISSSVAPRTTTPATVTNYGNIPVFGINNNNNTQVTPVSAYANLSSVSNGLSSLPPMSSVPIPTAPTSNYGTLPTNLMMMRATPQQTETTTTTTTTTTSNYPTTCAHDIPKATSPAVVQQPTTTISQVTPPGSNSNYGTIPTSFVKNDNSDVRSSISLDQKVAMVPPTVVAASVAPSNYGQIPSTLFNQPAVAAEKQIRSPGTPPQVSPSNYGQIPSNLNLSAMMTKLNTNTTSQPAPTSNYGTLPTNFKPSSPVSKPKSPSIGGQVAPPAIPANYGTLPSGVVFGKPAAAVVTSSPAKSGTYNVSPPSPANYGQLPSTLQLEKEMSKRKNSAPSEKK